MTLRTLNTCVKETPMFMLIVLFFLGIPGAVFTSDLASAEQAAPKKQTEGKSKKKPEPWQLLGHDGQCASLNSLKHTFPDMPSITTPQQLERYLKTHQGTPLLYPIDDPKMPELKGYSLFDRAHDLSLMILPTKQCKGRFAPIEQPEEPPAPSRQAP
jgi:hypothetical protein